MNYVNVYDMGNIIFSWLYKYCTNMAHNDKGGEKLTMLQSRDIFLVESTSKANAKCAILCITS